LAKKRGHGEGSISQRKDGRWMGQITLGINPATKKAKRLTFYGKTRKEVQEKIREALNQKDKGMLSEPSKLTLQEWLKTWLEDYKQRELKESTWESYKSLIEDYINPDLGMVKLSKLRTNDIQRFYNEKTDQWP
jgi:integrase